ncbi:MAG TPA: PAS domain S-box protein, partial [Methanoregula sp.]|nr:PAS domain S-box protein [Methanoregula sp.]
ALDFFGYSSGELIGKPLIGTIIPEKELSTGRDLTGMVNEIVRDPSLFARHENEARMKNGNLVWIRWTNAPLLNPEGTIREFTKVGIDITDMKRAEHALKKTTQYLENLFDYANAPIIVWDRDFRITRFNHAFELLTDRKASEVLGQDLAIIFPEQYTGQALDMIRRTMTGEHLETVEIPVQTRNGETRIVLWNSATLTEADGKTVESTIAQGQDITERKRAEAALRLSEERFRELAESAGSIILRYDCRGRITYFNEYAEKFFGFSRDEILGKSGVGTIIPVQESGSGRDLGKMVSDIVDKPDQYAENENENIRKNGERVWIHWTNRPVYNPDGTIREFTAIGSDITDRRFAEMELERKNMDLNAVNEELRATQEELRRNVAKLTRREHQLEEALAEKEILLSEIHHRVKNNLSAFISLLSLDGTYEKTDAGQMLRQDLQNRARSMALIHETLYRTGKFSNVDMEIYLTTLIEQVAGLAGHCARKNREVHDRLPVHK